MKLRNRIHIYSTLLTLVILVILTVVIYYSFSSLAYSTEVDELDAAAEALLVAYNANPVANPSDLLRGYVPVLGLIKVTGPEGNQLNLIQSPEVTAQFPDQIDDSSGTVQVDGERFAYTTTPIIWPDGTVAELLIAKSLREVTGNLNTLRLVLAVAVVLAMIPVIISGAVLAGIVTKPITALTATMRNIQRNGRFQKLPISDQSHDELNQMGMTFNEMMALLEDNYLKQEEFVSNASHELKTPLTIIGSYAKLLERQGMDNREVAEESITAIQSETNRMTAMIEQLLLIARRNETKPHIEEIELTALLAETTAALNRSYEREFIFDAEDRPLYVWTDSAKLKQLLYILLDNARKYSSDRIEISVKMDDTAIVQIRDYGEGIPKESLPLVFDRFYRVDKARNRGTGGFGLGLALASQLAESLKLKLEIDSIEALGTTVTIKFSSDFNVVDLKSDEEGSS
ncbi:ATP-binding protein [Planococcus sp. X10-3]|uniref:HAMP domain-containing sensor histidine kinase n=1 Tax=Planococcus sp. X10-3 TaxID=3061240 RepID=UPI003BB0C40E